MLKAKVIIGLIGLIGLMYAYGQAPPTLRGPLTTNVASFLAVSNSAVKPLWMATTATNVGFFSMEAGTNVLLSITSTSVVFSAGTAGIGVGSVTWAGAANTNTGSYSVIAGGGTNRNEGPWNVIGGGRNNFIYGSDLSNAVAVIAGGEDNSMPLGNNKHAVIGGGQSNLLVNGRYAGILSGWQHKVGSASHVNGSNAVICGGWFNTNDAFNAFLGGGYKNRIIHFSDDQGANVLVGGGANIVHGSYNGLVAGGQNVITNASGLIAQGQGCFIGAGRLNWVTGLQNGVVAGNSNYHTNDSQRSLIGCGTANMMDQSVNSGILAGNGNRIDFAEEAFIGAGNINRIGQGADDSAIVGGRRNRIEDFTTQAFAIGSDLTNSTSSSVEIGFSDGTKSRFTDKGTVSLGARAEASAAVTLTADNQSVNTTTNSYIRLQSNDVTAGNRTWVLTQGSFTGQILDIEWVGTNAGELVDDSAQTGAGNHRMNGTWTPTQYDILMLRFNGTDWVERGRSPN